MLGINCIRDVLHVLLEVLTVNGTILYLSTIVVDGVYGVVEELGYLCRLVDAEAYEGEDAELCR